MKSLFKMLFFMTWGLGFLGSCNNLDSSGGIISGQPLIVDHINYDPSVLTQSQLDAVRYLDIYFQHASVGGNVCDGIDSLMTSDSKYSLNRTGTSAYPTGELDAAWFDTHNGLGDLNRGNPPGEDKITRFYNSLHGTSLAPKLDVATWKFCYIDNPSNAQVLFDSVRASMESLEIEFPLVTFVWWTMPIETSANAQRQSYNNLVRTYCQNNNKWLLDIADLESHDNNGVAAVDVSGNEILAAGYTSDGGHLNAAGAEKLAKAFWRLLGQVANRW